jgi:hypothetical protein
MDVEKACDVCNFLVGFGVSTAEFEAFANKLASKNRLVTIKDGKVGARGLGVLSRSLPDLVEFQRQQEALLEAEQQFAEQQAKAEQASRARLRVSAQSVVQDALASAVFELTSSAC